MMNATDNEHSLPSTVLTDDAEASNADVTIESSGEIVADVSDDAAMSKTPIGKKNGKQSPQPRKVSTRKRRRVDAHDD